MTDVPDICPVCGSNRVMGTNWERFVYPEEDYDDEIALNWECRDCGATKDSLEEKR